MNPPYKIRLKHNPDSGNSDAAMMNASFNRFSMGFNIIKREIKFGGANCILEPRIAMLILLYDMPNFRKYLCLSP
jgi:hypothetical protein